MEINNLKIINTLDSSEIDVLLNLYYTKDSLIDSKDSFSKNLLEKNLISTEIEKNKTKMQLTDTGLNLCGAILKKNISEKEERYNQEMDNFLNRSLSFLVNRIIYHNSKQKEFSQIKGVNEYSLSEDHWYERVLLKKEKIVGLMNDFYEKLEKLGFVKKINDKIYSSSELEDFLKEKYKNIMDLTWAEEDSLKYFYFFYIYAQDQKNLINFTGVGEEYRSMFFGKNTSPPDYWFSSNRSDPRELISNLALSQKRVIGFLEDMKIKNIVNERYYPLSSFSFFSEEDRIYVIQDIKSYMNFISEKFLDPVVKSLLN